jgi:hypothetical protein
MLFERHSREQFIPSLPSRLLDATRAILGEATMRLAVPGSAVSLAELDKGY